uniref:Uncharacterized protein n=1 Tax=Rousettus aegyptiacus TaxID=9407 RepID=A0A7J8DXE2_ROUAE|nr:hypothetical protein HJG63_008379 [Rousettus aegyptiacus]
MEEVKISTVTGVWKKLIPTLTDDFERFKISVEEVTAYVVEIAREPELEVEPEYVTELFQSHDKTLMNEEFLVMGEQRQWFLQMDSTPGEDTVTIVEMTTKNLEYYINLVDKAVAGVRRTDSSFESSSTVSKMLSDSTECYIKIVQSMWQTLLLSYFKKLLQPPSL